MGQVTRTTQPMQNDRKGTTGVGREVPTKNRFARSRSFVNVDIGRPKDWDELIRNTQQALDNLREYLDIFTQRTEQYKDDEGRVLVGGLAPQSVYGGNLVPAIVDELQTMGSTLTDDEWKNLHR